MKRTREILSKKRVEPATDEEMFQAICLDVSENLDADITSIWFFDPEHTQIECQYCYDALEESFTKGQVLEKTDFPAYFSAVVEYNFISAPDAWTHTATKELIEVYFKPKGIVSLLDFIIHVNFKPVGVICCENRRGIRDWSEQNKDYLRSIASLTSFHFRFSH